MIIYYFKRKSKIKKNENEKTILKIKEYFSFKLIGEIFQLQIFNF